VLPAHQRLGADHVAAVEVHERLVEEPQLAVVERALELLLDRERLDRPLAHRHVEQLGSVPAALLGSVHRGVGILHEP
jgi:hypothetical protein